MPSGRTAFAARRASWSVVGGEDDQHRCAFQRCLAVPPPVPGCPCRPRSSNCVISLAAKDAPSAVPCTSTKPPRRRHHDVHVGVAGRVLDVLRSSSGVPGRCHRNGGDESSIGRRADLARRPAHGVVRHEGAGDRRGARAAIGLQHVAIERQVRSPSESFRSNTQRSERPMRRWISCAAGLLARAASRSPGVRGARRHAVFGRDPASP